MVVSWWIVDFLHSVAHKRGRGHVVKILKYLFVASIHRIKFI